MRAFGLGMHARENGSHYETLNGSLPMANFAYVALDGRGRESKGCMLAADQQEALLRLKSMGYYPTQVAIETASIKSTNRPMPSARSSWTGWMRQRVKPKVLTEFTRQLATVVDSGIPLVRGLRLLEEQEENRNLRRIIGELAAAIENGSSFSEAIAQHPRVFNRLYENMVRAGEVGGVLEIVLNRLAEFMEKAQKIKGKVVAALFYPLAVLLVAFGILSLLMVYVIPKFKAVFADLIPGGKMPAFTMLVLNLSQAFKDHFLLTAGILALASLVFRAWVSTRSGRKIYDRCKLRMPLLGAVIRKASISRFMRTFGTLTSSGVPVLQALAIVKETAGNAVIEEAIAAVHTSVKEGDTITAPLKASRVFPAVVIGMVDVGEQTGALPEMMMKIADNYDDDVDNAVSAMTSLMEPILIVFLGVVVGSIVIALFLPILSLLPSEGKEGIG